MVASTFMAERRFQVRGKNEYLYGVEILPMFRNYDYEVMIGPGTCAVDPIMFYHRLRGSAALL